MIFAPPPVADWMRDDLGAWTAVGGLPKRGGVASACRAWTIAAPTVVFPDPNDVRIEDDAAVGGKGM